MTRVYLIRHGKPRSAWGDQGSDPDPGLDDVGRTQAQAASDWLIALPTEQRPTHVLTSPLLRCRETALPFALALDVEPRVEKLVAEIPTPTGLTAEERGPWLRAAFQQTWAGGRRRNRLCRLAHRGGAGGRGARISGDLHPLRGHQRRCIRRNGG